MSSVLNRQRASGSAAQAGGGYSIDQSCRFNDDDSAYLSRTPRVAGNRRTFTYSFWAKRGDFTGAVQYLVLNQTDGSNWFEIKFGSGNTLDIGIRDAGTWDGQYVTSRVFPDPSAWYHIVVAVDTTQATAGNRIRIYVNGVEETSFFIENDPTQNIETATNATVAQYIGYTSTPFDGYRADVYLIDGQQLTASDFGEFSGVNWVPKEWVEGTVGADATISEVDSGVDATNQTTYTFSSKTLGTGDIVVAVGIDDNDSLSTVTVDGNSADLVASTVGASAPPIKLAFYKYNGNTAATGDIVVTGTSGLSHVGITVFLLTGANTSLYDVATVDIGAVNALDLPLTIPAGGVGMGYVYNDNSYTHTWAGLTEGSVDGAIEGSTYHSAASGAFSTKQTNLTITATRAGSAGSEGGIAISFGPTDTTYGINGFHLDFADSSHFGKDVVETAPYEPVAVNFDGTNDYLNRGAGLAGNADSKVGTFSGWFKMGADGSALKFMEGTGHVKGERLASNAIQFTIENAAGTAIGSLTSTSTDYTVSKGWFHVFAAWDLANTNAYLYINGVDDLGSSTISNDTIDWDEADFYIGSTSSASQRWNGEMADIYLNTAEFVDPTTASNLAKFISTKGHPVDLGSDGSTPTGTAPIIYLTNALATWHTNTGGGGGFTETGALTAGTNQDLIGRSLADSGLATNDQVLDSPTDDAANDVGNYATISPINKHASLTLANGNTEASAGAHYQGYLTQSRDSGKFVVWLRVSSTTAGRVALGVANADDDQAARWGDPSIAYSTGWGVRVQSTTQIQFRTSDTGTNRTLPSSKTWEVDADYFMMAVDVDAAKVWFGFYDDSDSSINWCDSGGTWRTSDEPGLGTNETYNTLGDAPYTPFVVMNTGGNTTLLEAGAGVDGTPFQGATLPSGFSPLCSANKPTPAITDPSQYFQVDAFTGTGAELARTLTDASGAAFKPDLVWIKDRDTAVEHVLVDSARGATKEINSDSTNGETTVAQGLKSFDASGYTLGTDTNYNASGSAQVAWCWRTQGGAGSSNTDGSINTITTSVNTTAGISISTYTGTGANATVGHGLTNAPGMVWGKRTTDAESWMCWFEGMGGTDYFGFDAFAAVATSATVWNSTVPSSTVVSLGSNASINGSGKANVIMCFEAIDGFSKFGSYEGNGSDDGPFVWLGFRPVYILVKRTDSAGSWLVHDSARDPYNIALGTDKDLSPDTTGIEDTVEADGFADFLSNGFKIRDTTNQINNGVGTYVFAAFAEAVDVPGVSQARAR